MFYLTILLIYSNIYIIRITGYIGFEIENVIFSMN